MDTWENYKRLAGRYAVMTLVVMILADPVGSFFAGYISFLGVLAQYIGKFVAVFLLIIISNWATKSIFEVN